MRLDKDTDRSARDIMKQKSAERLAQSERRKQVRKEKSKEAARNRREKECEIFTELTDSVPVAEEAKAPMDKTSIMRLAISFMKLRNIYRNVWDHDTPQSTTSPDKDVLLDLEQVSSDFVIAMTTSNDIVFVTANVKQRLGINQSEMLGHDLRQFIHPSDWEKTEQTLRTSHGSISFTARIKSTLLPKGRVVNLKSATYTTVKFSGQRFASETKSKQSTKLLTDSSCSMSECIVLTGAPIEHLLNKSQDLPRDSMTFTSKHHLSMKFSQCDDNVADLTKYAAEKLIDSSFYDFIHTADLKSVEASFKSLYTKDHVQTDLYRFLANRGGYVRVITQASLIHDTKSGRPQQISCVHHVISQVEEPGLIMAAVQSSVKLEKYLADERPLSCSSSSGMDILKPLAEMKMDCSSGSSNSSTSGSTDDIFSSTASVFLSSDDDAGDGETFYEDNGIFKATEGVFEPVQSSTESELTTNNIFSTTASMFDESSADCSASNLSQDEKTDLELLVADLEDDYIDMSGGGLFADVPPNLSGDDAEDMFWRAPYIPMDGFSDQYSDMESRFDVDCKSSPCSDDQSYSSQPDCVRSQSTSVPPYHSSSGSSPIDMMFPFVSYKDPPDIWDSVIAPIGASSTIQNSRGSSPRSCPSNDSGGTLFSARSSEDSRLYGGEMSPNPYPAHHTTCHGNVPLSHHLQAGDTTTTQYGAWEKNMMSSQSDTYQSSLPDLVVNSASPLMTATVMPSTRISTSNLQLNRKRKLPTNVSSMGGDTGVPPDLPQDMVPQAMSDSLKQDLDQIVECLYLSVDNIDELIERGDFGSGGFSPPVSELSSPHNPEHDGPNSPKRRRNFGDIDLDSIDPRAFSNPFNGKSTGNNNVMLGHASFPPTSCMGSVVAGTGHSVSVSQSASHGPNPKMRDRKVMSQEGTRKPQIRLEMLLS